LGALILLFTISLMGATLALFFSSISTVADVEVSRAKALYLAEAGVAKTVSQLRQAAATGEPTIAALPATALGEGRYEVEHDPSSGLITATGTVHGISRTIQVKYHLL